MVFEALGFVSYEARHHAEETSLRVLAHRRPSADANYAMSSPMVRTCSPWASGAADTSMARLVLPQAEGSAAVM